MIRYNKLVIDWFLEQQLFCLTQGLNCRRLRATVQSSGQTKQLLSSDPVNNCVMSSLNNSDYYRGNIPIHENK